MQKKFLIRLTPVTIDALMETCEADPYADLSCPIGMQGIGLLTICVPDTISEDTALCHIKRAYARFMEMHEKIFTSQKDFS